MPAGLQRFDDEGGGGPRGGRAARDGGTASHRHGIGSAYAPANTLVVLETTTSRRPAADRSK